MEMKVNNLNGEEIGVFLKRIHEKFYDTSNDRSNLFEGGNVGNLVLGLALIEASENIKEGLKEVAKSIRTI